MATRWLPLGFLGALAAALCGCGPTTQLGQSRAVETLAAPTTPVESQPLGGAAPVAPIGNGPTRVGLILPLTSNGQPSVVGVSMRNAADLALSDSGGSDITLTVKDDQSSPAGAQAAAQSAIDDGAQLLIGPLFAADVREVSRIASGAGKPVIAFSTDATTRQRGTYLLSFLIESYVDRVLDYAIARGKKSFAVLAPDTDVGTVALGAFQQQAARRSLRVVAIERYAPGRAAASIARLAPQAGSFDSLFIPEGADAMPAIGPMLTQNNLDSRRVQILGTGLWNDARVLRIPALQGAWFAAPDNAGFNAFAQKYRAKYGSDPTRLATLAYDATSLAAALARTQGARAFTDEVLTAPSGFNGADGVFRFRPDGSNQRALSVLQVANGSTTVLEPAPRTFASNGGI